MDIVEKTVEKDILLTGASGTIGSAIAERLSEKGYRLHITVRTKDRAKDLIEKLKAKGFAVPTIYECEMANTDSVEKTMIAFFEGAKNPFGIICNAGNLGVPGKFKNVNFAAWKQSFDANFFAHAQMVHLFINQYEKQKLSTGRIVIISGAGIGGSKTFENISSYSTAKAAVTHFTEALAAEIREMGLTINAIAPGAVVSGMTEQALGGEQRELGAYYQEAQKIKASGGVSPFLAADLIVHLLQDASATVTGRLLSARFDKPVLEQQDISKDQDLFRLRRIDNALFERAHMGC